MKRTISIFIALLLASCGDDQIAENTIPPDISVTSETPGDWSALEGMVGRTPNESGLFEESPILIDLNAMLGPSAAAYRRAMADATALEREGALLVSRARNGGAFLVIDPAQYGLLAGLRQGDGWRTAQTAGAEMVQPPSVRALVQSGLPSRSP